MDKRLLMRWWRVPRDEIPQDKEARIDWLFSWWERIDAWVEEHRPEDLEKRHVVRDAAQQTARRTARRATRGRRGRQDRQVASTPTVR